MKIRNLPPQKQEEIEKVFKSSKSAKEQNRIQTIRLLTKGFTYKQVQIATGLSARTVQELAVYPIY